MSPTALQNIKINIREKFATIYNTQCRESWSAAHNTVASRRMGEKSPSPYPVSRDKKMLSTLPSTAWRDDPQGKAMGDGMENWTVDSADVEGPYAPDCSSRAAEGFYSGALLGTKTTVS